MIISGSIINYNALGTATFIVAYVFQHFEAFGIDTLIIQNILLIED